jgi:hypothetical protein
LFFVAFIASFLGLPSAHTQAHPYGYSTFEAEANGQDIVFFFRFDATSVVDLINRLHPDESPIEAESAAILSNKEEVMSYVDERFEVLNLAHTCKRQDPSFFYFHAQEKRVQVRVGFHCDQALDHVEIRSTLFLDEATPHQVLGTFRYKNALEKYFFTGGERVATIYVHKLKQLENLAPSSRAGFQMATPPPGVSFAQPKPQEKPAPAETAKASEEVTSEATVGGPDKATPSASKLEDTPVSASNAGAATVIESNFLHFLGQGIIHILGGYDHVLFVLSLLVAIRSWRELFVIVSSFTVAHSITLILGALGWVTVSPVLVEPVIALSILYVAIENMWRKSPQARSSVTFGFGLIHGLGFSFVLQGLGLPDDDYVPTLLGFNLGVELGQLIIVTPIFPLLLLLRRRERAFRQFGLALNVCVALMATYWFYERVFA